MSGPPPKPAPKNPGFVTCTIDGKEAVVSPGTNMIEAAKTVGSEIPFYCYHPRLSIAANCRMCLVETSTAPKLVPACQTPLAEGMAVKTTSAKVKDQQRATLEFLLINHPVDCAICDQAGECKLQDYYMKYDFKPSRLDGPKVLKSKRKVLGPQVVLDQERCILCTRCVRFMDEVAHEPQLGVFGRGSSERIDVFPGAQLDSNYAGNTVDICPVGALLNRDFRFRARVWFLSAAPTVCTGCSRGCNAFADHYGQETHRYRPRDNERINKSWMCDHGRMSYKYLDKGRVTFASIGRGPDAREATRAEALKAVADKLRPIAKQPGLAVLASPLASNEDLWLSLVWAKDVLGVQEIYLGGRPDGEADHFLMTADRNPNRKGLQWIAKWLNLKTEPYEALVKGIREKRIRALYAIGTEVPGDVAELEHDAAALEVFVAQATNHGPLLNQAHAILPAATHVEGEGSFVNLDGIIQRFRAAYPPKGDSQPHWKWAADLASAMGLALSYASAREVFRDLSVRVPELGGFDWDGAAPAIQKARGLTPLAAAADGRPPGYREFGIPRVRGL
jgi:NADH-quinone oxidoreductase subunit G